MRINKYIEITYLTKNHEWIRKIEIIDIRMNPQMKAGKMRHLFKIIWHKNSIKLLITLTILINHILPLTKITSKTK